MIPSNPVRIRLPLFVSIVLIATSVMAQSPPKYDRATETTVKGIVGELKLVPPTGSNPIAYLVTKTGPDKERDLIDIFLCPKKFLDQMGITFKPDEEIEIKGSKVKQAGSDLILAREMVKAGETLTFRFEDGKPVW